METAKTVACSIVASRIDYCNSLFYGMTARNFSKLQRIQNTVARIVSGNRRFDHITPVLKELHWLPVRERVDFKIGCMTFKALRNKQPTYLADVLHSYVPACSLRSSSMNNLDVPFGGQKLQPGRSRWQLLSFGIACHSPSEAQIPCKLFAKDSNHIYLILLINFFNCF